MLACLGKYISQFRKYFLMNCKGRFHQDETSDDHLNRTPNKNAFKGNIYLLISPKIASAGNLFVAILTTIIIGIGEETMGTYHDTNCLENPMCNTLKFLGFENKHIR